MSTPDSPDTVAIAPDSFKGELSAQRAAGAIAAGWSSVAPQDELRLVPMADGGEGTAAAMVAATGGTWIEVEAPDALGRPRTAGYGRLGPAAGPGHRVVIDVAAASGLDQLAVEELDIWTADSAGTGALLRHALEAGADEIVLGLGGSATNDGGLGIARALGLAVLDHEGREVPPGPTGLRLAARVEAGDLHPRLRQVRIRAACDVTNPLTGPEGATTVFGPQKGAGSGDIAELDAALGGFATLLQRAGLPGDPVSPGAGAAGGIGYLAQVLLRAELVSGVDLVASLVGLEDACRGASLVLTGEGRLNGQTASGKVPLGVAQIAERVGAPTVALVGSLGAGYERVLDTLAAVLPIGAAPRSLPEAIEAGEEDLRRTSATVAALHHLRR